MLNILKFCNVLSAKVLEDRRNSQLCNLWSMHRCSTSQVLQSFHCADVPHEMRLTCQVHSEFGNHQTKNSKNNYLNRSNDFGG